MKERFTIEEAQDEFLRDIGSRLSDKEIFVLIHLAEIRKAYEKIARDGDAGTKLLFVDGSDTIANIANTTNVNYQIVRYVLHAMYLMGFVEKKRMNTNAQSWAITNRGGRALDLLLSDDHEKESLVERFKKATRKNKK